MVTPLDIAAFQEFQGVFAFLFVLIATYAILGSTDFFKERKVPLALISFMLGFLTLYNTIALKTVNLMAPWFVLFMLFTLLMMLGFMVLGVKHDDIIKTVKEGEFAIGIWMAAVLLLIGLGSLAFVFTEETGGIEKFREYNESRFAEGEFPLETPVQTLLHPNFLGFVMVLLIAVFTIKYMGEGQ